MKTLGAVGPFDADAEVARAWAELVREVPAVLDARLITTCVSRDASASLPLRHRG